MVNCEYYLGWQQQSIRQAPGKRLNCLLTLSYSSPFNYFPSPQIGEKIKIFLYDSYCSSQLIFSCLELTIANLKKQLAAFLSVWSVVVEEVVSTSCLFAALFSSWLS